MKWLFFLLLFTLRASAQDAAPGLNARITEAIARAAGGHSPTSQEIAEAATFDAPPDAAAIRAALPALGLALPHPDVSVRLLTLTALTGLETANLPVAEPTHMAPGAPAAMPTASAEALLPLVPALAARLTDDSIRARLLAVQVLAGFAPAAPAAVSAALEGYLKRPEAAGAVGEAAVSALLTFGPPRPETVAAIARFLRRSDQSADERANLVDAVSSAPAQSATLNAALLDYLRADDPGVRARLILSLPALELSPDDYADTHARVVAIAEGGQDALAVVTAAKQVAGCWTSVHMTAGCPSY